jgi:DNA-directed RNA polymerase specialized sigma24 family protein
MNAAHTERGPWDAPAGPPGDAAAASDARLVAIIDAVAGRDERALAEEVVEDACFQAWRQAVRFDPARGCALGWLLAMARSRALGAWRRESRFGRAPLAGGGVVSTDGSA